MNNNIKLGIVADDFTGASDAASFLTKGGMRVLLYNGISLDEEASEADAIVVALKTRTKEKSVAVTETMEAIEWLKHKGADQFYIKYCSTFDSTPVGNIGPVLDKVLNSFDIPFTILAPSLPVNGRIVEAGELYVNGQPLHKSPLRNHPLTPMWASKISELMYEQSNYPTYTIRREELSEQNWHATQALLSKYQKENIHFYIVPDFVSQEDGEMIVNRFGNLKVLSGGSGLMQPLAEYLIAHSEIKESTIISPKVSSYPIMVAGSCSEQTLKQIDNFEKNGGISYKIYPEKIASDEQNEETIEEFIKQNEDKPVLIYSSASKDEREKSPDIPNLPDILERLLSRIALYGINNGRKQVIVAGGETSGSVMQALGSHSFYISESVSPGIPVMIPTDRSDLRVVLKSGNFGEVNFLDKAINLTSEKGESML